MTAITRSTASSRSSGASRPLTFDLRVDDGAVHAAATVTQTRFGMKPFSALFGTLKVLDDVEVRLDGRLDD